MSRQKQNLEILKELDAFYKANKDIRFIQGLWALGLIGEADRFYEESVATLNTLINRVDEGPSNLEPTEKKNKGCKFCKFYMEDYGCANEENVKKVKFPYNYIDGKTLPAPAKDFNSRLECDKFEEFTGLRWEMKAFMLGCAVLIIIGVVIGLCLGQSLPCTVR